MKVLVVDVGGHHVKILATGQTEPRRFESGPTMTAEQMVSGVKDLTPEVGNMPWSPSASLLGRNGSQRFRATTFSR